MEKKKRKRLLTALAVFALVLLAAVFVPGCATDEDSSSFTTGTMNYYKISAVIGDDCSAEVTETISVPSVGGKFSHTIQTPDGMRVKNVKMYLVTEDDDGKVVSETDPGYTVSSDKSETTITAKHSSGYSSQIFKITYRYVNIGKTKTNDNEYISLSFLGGYLGSTIRNVDIELTLPAKLYEYSNDQLTGAMVSLQNSSGTPIEQYPDVDYSEDELTIRFSADSVTRGNTLNFMLFFDKGVLRSGTGDLLPWLLLLVIAAVAAAAVALRLTVFKERKLLKAEANAEPGEITLPARGESAAATPGVKSLSSQGESAVTDPLRVRRILECKVENRDVVSLLLCWAERGYIKLNVKSQNNPVFVKAVPSLPEGCPESWRNLFAAMFSKSDRATLRSVSAAMLPAMQEIKKEANARREVSYDKKRIALGVVFAAAASVFLALMPTLLPLRVSSHAFSPIYLVTMIPALLVFAFLMAVYAARGRNSRNLSLAYLIIALVIAVACAVLYIVFVPNGNYALWPKIICMLLSLATIVFSASYAEKSAEYGRKRAAVDEAIAYMAGTNPEDAASLLREDPALYYRYHSLSQILRMEGVWSDKFKGTVMQYPEWIEQDKPTTHFATIRDTIREVYVTIYSRIYRKK